MNQYNKEKISTGIPLHPPAHTYVYGLPPQFYTSRSSRYAPASSDSYALLPPELPLSALEALTISTESGRSPDPVAGLMADKRRFWEASVADIMGSMFERERLRDENLREIGWRTEQLRTQLSGLKAWEMTRNSQVDKLRFNMESELNGMEKEMRFEEVACWRDTTRLKSELREALMQFEGERRKETLLGGFNAGRP